MRFDLGLLLGVLFEFLPIYFLFTANLPLRKSVAIKNVYSIIGYVLILFVGGFGNIISSIAAFLVINFIFIYRCFKINILNALFQCVILDVVSVMSEYIIVWFMNVNITLTDSIKITPYQSIILTLMSKIIFLLGVILLKKLTTKGEQYETQNIPIIIALPILSLFLLIFITESKLSYTEFICMGVFILMTNVLFFKINDMFCKTKSELCSMRADYEGSKAALEKMKVDDKSYQQMRILKHDFKEYINTLEALNARGNTAQNFSNELKKLYSNFLDDNYSDNEVFNVFINQKLRECINKNIDLSIDPIRSSLKFIADVDVVTIFSNLMNNAIEASEDSEAKKIFLDIGKINNVFTIIKTENSSKIPPETDENGLVTTKEDKQNHGFGIKSILYTVEKYHGLHEWFYDKKIKYFRTVVVMNSSRKPGN